ncbi:hypothetical protein L6164_026957 [Bauhinia variegata]|uniref:Uncharacterized protein n=1 Tax=Bauhinia variegata TaxID=167791 RepID=A0ACB9LT95_BAUVA|nr:hypothetical protein L6164_026957 [Bauhinia variegata]
MSTDPFYPFSSSLFFIIPLFLSLSSMICSHGLVIKDGLERFQELRLPNVIGPESLAFDCHGRGPYASVSDGRILKWRGPRRGWIEFAVTSPTRDRKSCDGSTDPNKEEKCGRPLGLQFDPKTCNLYIADAYYGLHMVGPCGGVAKQLAISAGDGVHFKFLNALDVETQTGVVYFTDSSTVYQRREWPKIVLKGDKTGRLLKYDPRQKDKEDPVGVKLDEKGKPIEVVDGGGGEELDSVSEVLQHDGKLWFGSVLKPYVGVLGK